MLRELDGDAEEQALVVRVRPRKGRALGEHPGKPLGALARAPECAQGRLCDLVDEQAVQQGREAPKGSGSQWAASSSSAGSTLAEADLCIAKNNIDDLHKQIAELVAVRGELHMHLHKSVDLGNQQLSTAARSANQTVNAHARELRTTKAITAGAIAKMKAMRQHAHGFAELMLPHVAADKAPGHIACWAAFSGLLIEDAIGNADWASKKKKPSNSSATVYDITEFDKFTNPATINLPAPNVAFNLTAAKAKAPALPGPTTSHLIPSIRSRSRSRARARGP